jgi:Arm DNA-binding domain
MGDSNKLSALKVAREKRPGRYGDGGNLWLQVTSAGSKSWLLRYMLNGQAHAMGLGPVDLVSLQEARELARDARRLVLKGVDPIDHRKAAKAAARVEAAQGEPERCS